MECVPDQFITLYQYVWGIEDVQDWSCGGVQYLFCAMLLCVYGTSSVDEQLKYDVLVNQIVNGVDKFISLYFFKFDFMTTNSLYYRFLIV